MNKDQFLETIKEIGTTEDDVSRRTLLAKLNDDVSGVFDDYSKVIEENEKYRTDNETLRNANMQLFLQVGENKSTEDITKQNTGIEPTKEKLKFEDLFDEKGGLK